ncbi:MAG: DUF4145 domain-containing protein [Planctomycetes bacterium]|nr:DUF4145 domain-containing protein [Planctomycetota bacterium]
MFGRTTLSKRVAQLESQVASIRRLYEKTLAYSDSDPETALMNARKAAEAVCSRVFEHKVGKPPKSMTLQPLIEKLAQLDAVPENILIALRTIQSYGNFGSHHQAGEPQPITAEFAQPCLQALGTVVQWYFNQFGLEPPGSHPPAQRSRVRDSVGQKRFSVGSLPAIATALALLTAAVAGMWVYRGLYQPINRADKAGISATPREPTAPARQRPSAEASATPQPASTPPPTHSTPRIAVLPFTSFSSDKDDLSGLQQGIGTVVASRLQQSGMFDVVERDRLEAVLAELDLSQSQKFDSSQVAQIGKLLGAQQLVLGSFFRFGEKLRLDARFVDTETGRVLCSANRDGPPDKIDLVTDSLCDDLLSKHATSTAPKASPGQASQADAAVPQGIVTTLREMFAACNAENMEQLRGCLSAENKFDSYDFSDIDGFWSVNTTYSRLDKVELLDDSDAPGAAFEFPYATVRVTQTVISLSDNDERNEVFRRRCKKDDTDLKALAERLGFTTSTPETTSLELLFKHSGGQWQFVRTLTEPICAGSDAEKKRPSGMGVPFQRRHRP